MADKAREREVIEAFRVRMSALLRETWQVIEWPDENDIDAVLLCEQRRAVLDHTLLNSYAEQRRLDSQFVAVANPLERELKAACGDHFVRVLLPMHAMPKREQSAISEALRVVLTAEIPRIPPDGEFHPIAIAAVGGRVQVSREKGTAGTGCFFGRLLNENHLQELEDDLVRAIDSKSRQLAASRNSKQESILLLETTDIATINEVIVAQAFERAAKRTSHAGLDAVFLFDDPLRDHSTHMVWPLKYRGRLPPDYAWMDEFRRAQGALVYAWVDRGPGYVVEANLGNSGDWPPPSP